MRESVALAFVAALQHLPPRQRAVLVLRDVLGFRTTEVAGILASSEGSVKGALQRARTTLDERIPAGSLERAPVPGSARERDLVDRFAIAFEHGDTDGIVSLLRDDAWVTMPPEPQEYQGGAAIAEFLHDRERARGGTLWLVPTRANGQPAFGCYLPAPGAGQATPYLLMVLSLDGDRVSAITFFGDRGLFPQFGLPRILERRR
jgi:RNA polymerase sigma-70 factor (ECF subfamily)